MTDSKQQDSSSSSSSPQNNGPTPKQLAMQKKMQNLVAGHVDSMNDLYANLDGLASMTKKAVFNLNEGELVELQIVDIHIDKPTFPNNALKRSYPSECRIGAESYTARMTVDVMIRYYELSEDNNTRKLVSQYKTKGIDCGHVPVMVGTTLCNTHGLNPHEMARIGEDFYEFGGYFLSNGNERVCRMSITQKRNIPIPVKRPIRSHDKFSDMKIYIRSVKNFCQIITWLLIDPAEGSVVLRLAKMKSDYHFDIFLMLKALFNATEKQICDLVVGKREENPALFEFFQFLLRKRNPEDRLMSHLEARIELGSRFSSDNSIDPLEACKTFFDENVLIHLDNDQDKFYALIFAFRRLLLMQLGEIQPDDQDSFHMHEIITPSIVFGTLLQHVLSVGLKNATAHVRRLYQRKKRAYERDARKKNTKRAASSDSDENSSSDEDSDRPETEREQRKRRKALSLNDVTMWNTALSRCLSFSGPAIRTSIATGNFPTNTADKVWLNSFTALFISAQRLNMLQFMSHFRVAHRGQQFTDTKLLSPRRLQTSSWGFICPVHTPDGTLCGLVNHITSSVVVSEDCKSPLLKNIPFVCKQLGMMKDAAPPLVPVLYNGKLLGGVLAQNADEFVRQLRIRKVQGQEIPSDTEIGYHRFSRLDKKQFPFICLSTHECRLMRPVVYLPLGKVEHISPLEQAHLHICIDKNSFIRGKTTHQEQNKANILGILGNLTPFSEHNQSPRNIYECGMAKQSMSNPAFSLDFRSDTKSFKLEHPQKPISRTFMQSEIATDDYPYGTNAIVAVISHTGHDMEDGMIICKNSMQRGFAYGSVYSTEKQTDKYSFFTSVDPYEKSGSTTDQKILNASNSLDAHGLPRVGDLLKKNDILCSMYDLRSARIRPVSWTQEKNIMVDRVTMISSSSGIQVSQGSSASMRGKREGNAQNMMSHIVHRIPVPANIGDKFASRHGQKGICSLLYPQEDMPFNGSGMVPDIIINPNAFPSRMTIGMLIESMSGKAGAIHGKFCDASSFGTNLGFDEKSTPVDHFGKDLAAAGYNYYGSEILYDGTTGEEMKAEIFFGVVYYQRLKHMVIDKYQSRAQAGPVEYMTKQPAKGRKRGGGIRFGEMERDALLSHGASSLLRDRLLHCSDETTAWVCNRCGRFFSAEIGGVKTRALDSVICSNCGSGRFMDLVTIPAVYRYLVQEMSGMGIELLWKYEAGDINRLAR